MFNLRRRLARLYSAIVKGSGTPEYVARGWAIGMFYGCFMPFGCQLVFSVPTALVLKGSKSGAVIGTFITNHFTIFMIYPIQCLIGNRIIGGDLTLNSIKTALSSAITNESFRELMSLGMPLIKSFFIGGALFALIMTPITYICVRTLVIRYRALRQKRRGN